MEAQNSQQVHQSKRMNASCFSNDLQKYFLTDSNGQAVASFRYDLHNGQIAASWNPANLELVNLKGGNRGSIRITTAVTGFNRDYYILPWPPIEINPPEANGNGNGNDWGGIGATIGIGAYVDLRASETEKDCGAMGMQGGPKSDPCEITGKEDCEELYEKHQNRNDKKKCPKGVSIKGENHDAVCKKSYECWEAEKIQGDGGVGSFHYDKKYPQTLVYTSIHIDHQSMLIVKK